MRQTFLVQRNVQGFVIAGMSRFGEPTLDTNKTSNNRWIRNMHLNGNEILRNYWIFDTVSIL